MSLPALLATLSWAAAILAIAVYTIGIWRRWRPGPDGKPAWASGARVFREPWTLAALGLLLAAVIARGLVRFGLAA